MNYIEVVGGKCIKLMQTYGCNTSASTAIDATGASWIVSNRANWNRDADASCVELN